MVLHFMRPRTICMANGAQGCGNHNMAISWDWYLNAESGLSVLALNVFTVNVLFCPTNQNDGPVSGNLPEIAYCDGLKV